MPLTPDMRRSIDQIRDYLFGGGYPDPVSNAEQLSFLFFFYLVEGIDAENKLKAKVLKIPCVSLFEGEWKLRNPLNAMGGATAMAAEDGSGAHATVLRTGAPELNLTIPRSSFRWSVWAKGLSGEALVRFLRDEVFAFFAEMGEKAAHNFMDGARLAIDRPDGADPGGQSGRWPAPGPPTPTPRATCSSMSCGRSRQAGELGQFRTPRHVIRSHRRNHRPQDRRNHLRPGGGHGGLSGRRLQPHPSGQLVAQRHCRPWSWTARSTSAAWATSSPPRRPRRLQSATFFGNDVDPKMVRLATMNLTLRGLPNVRILRNVLTTTLDNERKANWACRSRGLPRHPGQSAVCGTSRQGSRGRGREGRHQHRHRTAVPQIHDGQPAGPAAAAASSCPKACCSAPPARTRNCAGN
jgi:type I restriction enzyme M protein